MSFRLLPGRFGHCLFGPGLFRPRVVLATGLFSDHGRFSFQSLRTRVGPSRFSLGSFWLRADTVPGQFSSGSLRSTVISTTVSFGPSLFVPVSFRSRFVSVPGLLTDVGRLGPWSVRPRFSLPLVVSTPCGFIPGSFQQRSFRPLVDSVLGRFWPVNPVILRSQVFSTLCGF